MNTSRFLLILSGCGTLTQMLTATRSGARLAGLATLLIGRNTLAGLLQKVLQLLGTPPRTIGSKIFGNGRF